MTDLTADRIRSILGGSHPEHAPNWISRLALRACPPNIPPGQVARFYETTAVNWFPEVTVRIPTEFLTRRRLPKPQRRRIDLVALVQPHYKSWLPFTVGVEIKVSIHDLAADDKLYDYLPYCDYFYLAVGDQPGLWQAARDRICADGRLSTVGLLTVAHSGSVEELIKPGRNFPLPATLNDLYAELLIRPFRNAKRECQNFLEFERKF